MTDTTTPTPVTPDDPTEGAGEAVTPLDTEAATIISGLSTKVRAWLYAIAGPVGAAAGVVVAAGTNYPPVVVTVAGTVGAVCATILSGTALSNLSHK